MKTDSEETLFCTSCNINYSKSYVHNCKYYSYLNELESKLKKNNENFNNIKKSQSNFVGLMRDAKDDFKNKYNEIITTLTLIIDNIQKDNTNNKVEEVEEESPASLKATLIINVNKTETYLLNDMYCKAIIEWLGKEVRFDLIFRATRDGWEGTDFHRLCDKVGPTVTVLRNNQDRLIGGYTPLSWGEGSGYRKDDTKTGFVFSLTLMQICPMKESSSMYAINDTSSTGPKFGGGFDIEIVNNANVNQNAYDRIDFTYQFTGGPELFYGSKKWLVEEYEVYRVVDFN